MYFHHNIDHMCLISFIYWVKAHCEEKEEFIDVALNRGGQRKEVKKQRRKKSKNKIYH